MKLYTYYRSQASFRVRIALNLKGITREDSFLHLEKGRPVRRRVPDDQSADGGADLGSMIGPPAPVAGGEINDSEAKQDGAVPGRRCPAARRGERL